MFKKRTLKVVNRKLKLKVGTSGLFTFSPQQFEFVYLRILKKAIRRRYIKKRMRFRPCKFWLFLKPNCILSCKSTNARMGAGVGSMVRICTRLRSFVSFVEFRSYSPLFLKKIHGYIRYKFPLKFFSWRPM